MEAPIKQPNQTAIEPAKRKVGRPRKYGDQSLDGRIHLRITSVERGELERWANQTGTSISNLVRRELSFLLCPNNSEKSESPTPT